MGKAPGRVETILKLAVLIVFFAGAAYLAVLMIGLIGYNVWDAISNPQPRLHPDVEKPLTISDITVGVLIGNLLTLSMFWGFREAAKVRDLKDAGVWPNLAIALPALFAAAVLYLAA